MRRSATLPREGARASTTGIGPARRDALSSSRKASAQAFSAHSPFDSAAVKSLAINELLFGIGDPKTHFYAVKSGALVVYEPRWNGHRAVIEFAFPGDLVGLGFLQTHTCSARATVETYRSGKHCRPTRRNCSRGKRRCSRAIRPIPTTRSAASSSRSRTWASSTTR